MNNQLKDIVAKAEIQCENLECDGTARVLTFLLTEANIEHRVMVGSMRLRRQVITLHYWIELADGTIIDLKAKMWLSGISDVPHGIFKKTDTKAKYDGKVSGNVVPSKIMYDILTTKR